MVQALDNKLISFRCLHVPETILSGSDRAICRTCARPRLSDAAHLRTFRAEYGKKARAGLLLHTGQAIEWLAPDVLAAPWWTVL